MEATAPDGTELIVVVVVHPLVTATTKARVTRSRIRVPPFGLRHLLPYRPWKRIRRVGNWPWGACMVGQHLVSPSSAKALQRSARSPAHQVYAEGTRGGGS